MSNLIIVDIETTGVDRLKSGILSIGAIAIDSGNSFYVECKPMLGCLIDDRALEVNGFTREYIEAQSKGMLPLLPSERQAYLQFQDWAINTCGAYILGGENIANFDVMFLHRAYNGTFDMTWPFGRRFVDLHSLGFLVFGESMSKDKLALKLGLKAEEKPHNALRGALLEAQIFDELKRRI